MKLDCDLTLIINRLAVKELTEKAQTCLEMTAEALKTEVVNAEVVPFDKGTLQGSMDVDNSKSKEGKVKITQDTPYARRLYFHPEYNFRKTNNANAKGRWFEDWLPGGDYEDFAQETFAEFYRRFTGEGSNETE